MNQLNESNKNNSPKSSSKRSTNSLGSGSYNSKASARLLFSLLGARFPVKVMPPSCLFVFVAPFSLFLKAKTTKQQKHQNNPTANLHKFFTKINVTAILRTTCFQSGQKHSDGLATNRNDPITEAFWSVALARHIDHCTSSIGPGKGLQTFRRHCKTPKDPGLEKTSSDQS